MERFQERISKQIDERIHFMFIFRNSIRSLKNNRGVEAMRELWQQTGMITNGRKLLVDSLSEEEETDLQNKQHNHRKYPKRYLPNSYEFF